MVIASDNDAAPASSDYAQWLALYRSGQMPDEDFHARLREDEDFRRWAEEQTAD